MRYSSVALIKSLSITSLSPKLSSKSTLCNALDLVPCACPCPQSLWKDFSISFLKISHNIAEVLPTHQCHSLTQQINHIQSSRPSVNEELSSYLLPTPVEVMVAECQYY